MWLKMKVLKMINGTLKTLEQIICIEPFHKLRFTTYCPLLVFLLFLYYPDNLHAKNDNTVKLIAGGDVAWTLRVRKPGFYFGSEEKQTLKSNDGWRKLPFIATQESLTFLEHKYQRKFETDKAHFKTALQYKIDAATEKQFLSYPLKNISSLLQKADIAFVNLEMPLSDDGRLSGAFRGAEAFAESLSSAGIDIVSTANNHAFDAEGEGIKDTLNALKKSNVKAVGTGANLNEAASAKLITKKGQKIAFLAFTYGVNPTDTSLGFATHERSGAAPMDPYLIKEKIQAIRAKADVVIVSLHWGLENKSDVHPAARQFAHVIIDAGADVILGHHPHVPRGVEFYNKGLIVYSMGNLIFGHNHQYWDDNFLVELHIKNGQLAGAEFIPVAGKGKDLMQPYQLTGARAQETLQKLKARSHELGTFLTISGDLAKLVINGD